MAIFGVFSNLTTSWFTDGEEINLLGSKAFISQNPDVIKKTALNINIDMISGESRTKSLHYISQNLSTISTAKMNMLNLITVDDKFFSVRRGFRGTEKRHRSIYNRTNWEMASDHGVFYKANVPFIYYGVGVHKNYHSENDTFENYANLLGLDFTQDKYKAEEIAQAEKENSLNYQAAKIDSNNLQQALDACKKWGRLRGVVRTESGAVVELFLHGEDFTQKTSWLSIENESFHLHVNWSKVSSAYFASRKDKSYGLHFIDQHGQLIFRVLLTKQAGDFNPTLLQSFQQDWQALANRESQEHKND